MPRLQSINLNGDTDTGGRTRKALAEALNQEDSFPSLRRLSYPGERGTYKMVRGRNVRVHEYEKVGAKGLEEAAKKNGVLASWFRRIWSIRLRVLRDGRGSLLWVGRIIAEANGSIYCTVQISYPLSLMSFFEFIGIIIHYLYC